MAQETALGLTAEQMEELIQRTIERMKETHPEGGAALERLMPGVGPIVVGLIEANNFKIAEDLKRLGLTGGPLG